jgi:hypothetical protein
MGPLSKRKRLSVTPKFKAKAVYRIVQRIAGVV